MLRKLIPSLVPTMIVLQPSQVYAAPKHFREKIDKLNKQDEELAFQKLKQEFVRKSPERFWEVIEKMDRKVIEELDYIRVMYNPPLSPGARVRCRNAIMKLIDSRKCTQEEIECFLDMLKRSGCL